MKRINWYEWIYVAIAIATFKHTSWGFSTVLEGPEPVVDWTNITFDFTGAWGVATLLVWYAFGFLSAVVIDVGLFFVARALRETTEKAPLSLWGAYNAFVMISAYAQTLYAVQHAAQMTIVENTLPMLQPGGWLYGLYEYRLLILPVSLPVASVIYTIAVIRQQVLKTQPRIHHKDPSTGGKVYDVHQAARLTGLTESRLRQLAIEEDENKRIGHKIGKQWFFRADELEFIKKDK